jgi:acetyltransferase-like isoleucine patch superfamily enzyme
VEIGESTLVAAFSYIGPGNHKRGDGTKALIEEEMEIKGGVKIGARCWIGAHTTILDGVTIGDDAIVGAHSMVREDVPAGATVVGVPAKKIA